MQTLSEIPDRLLMNFLETLSHETVSILSQLFSAIAKLLEEVQLSCCMFCNQVVRVVIVQMLLLK